MYQHRHVICEIRIFRHICLPFSEINQGVCALEKAGDCQVILPEKTPDSLESFRVDGTVDPSGKTCRCGLTADGKTLASLKAHVCERKKKNKK